ncbi:site-specific tyrosine recombinase XerD [Clostridium zeae]|uniref:Site-specific tyrosine recombinase XerD n=1 Tax=Clostridium zeae TaxID=2759022 RepID=A0ABQ1E6P4_9CLOT|nr:tyrosine-type recombinase/integrase [Clostridium zeae]GFZ30447.1 site-specific tyrosine recombinase XerD [Clostridium zeae]
MNDFINLYKENLIAKNKSNNTIEAYITDIVGYYNFLKENNIDPLENDYSVNCYVQAITETKSVKSIERCVIALRSYYRFLSDKNLVKEVPKFPKVDRNERRDIGPILTVEEVEKIINCIDISNIKGVRDRAVLEMLYGTGIKATEAISLTVDDVNLDLNFITCKDGRGLERIIPFGRAARNAIIEYLSQREKISKDEKMLFLNLNGKGLTRQGVWRIVKEYNEKASIKKIINLNTLRHSFAIHLLENGANPKIVQQLMGTHVMNYMDLYFDYVSKDKVNISYNNFHPRA